MIPWCRSSSTPDDLGVREDVKTVVPNAVDDVSAGLEWVHPGCWLGLSTSAMGSPTNPGTWEGRVLPDVGPHEVRAEDGDSDRVSRDPRTVRASIIPTTAILVVV